MHVIEWPSFNTQSVRCYFCASGGSNASREECGQSNELVMSFDVHPLYLVMV
jgi:hypothetical protein